MSFFGQEFAVEHKIGHCNLLIQIFENDNVPGPVEGRNTTKENTVSPRENCVVTSHSRQKKDRGIIWTGMPTVLNCHGNKALFPQWILKTLGYTLIHHWSLDKSLYLDGLFGRTGAQYCNSKK